MRFNVFVACFMLGMCGIVKVHGDEVFQEHLDVQYLGDDRMLFTWEFDVVKSSHDVLSQHFNMFPKALGQIVQSHAVNELQLSFSSGQWDYVRRCQKSSSDTTDTCITFKSNPGIMSTSL